MSDSLKTVFVGTSWFAADLLRDLVAAGFGPQLVVSRPDMPAGRGRKLTPPDVVKAAAELELPTLQSERFDQTIIDAIEAIKPDAVVVCAYGALVTEPVLSSYPVFNVHPSLLPRWRGAAPIERSLMAGDSKTGVSIMHLVQELDAGPVYAQQTIEIKSADTYGTVAPRLLELGATMLKELLQQLLSDGSPPQPVDQPAEGISYAEKITAADRSLDQQESAVASHNRVRALTPHINARLLQDDGTWLGIRETRVSESGELELVVVQPAGKKPMSYEDYLRGRN